ncbi:MAG: iron-containing alcohol dehydrogenase, partial [Eubacterium sp.]|nr:iron-containing alcohol dehydrogenase [Eubacterium sp.]
MRNFELYTPTRILFGRKTEEQAGAEVARCGGSRVLIVFGGGSVVKSGLLARVEKSLEDAGIAYKEFGGAKPNPTLAHAEKGVAEGKAFEADFVLAVGGGSAIDTAKGIAQGLGCPDVPLWDLWTDKAPLEKALPVGTILTLAAAGSEMSSSAVLTNEAIPMKKGTTTEWNRPKFAIMNPELLSTVPKYHLACGVVDILMHTLDRYFIPDDTSELTDEIAEGVLRATIKNAPVVIEDPENYDAMAEIMWAGSISHNGLTECGRGLRDFPVHGLGHSLSAHYDATHGATLSSLWPTWARFTCDTAVKRFARLAAQLWGISEEDEKKAALAGIDATENFFRSIGAPVCISEMIGRTLSDEELHTLAMEITGNNSKTIGYAAKLDAAQV